jgi:hypothetical protein
MNARVKQLWLAALRDPLAKQCRGKMKRNQAFCPWGVLCDIFSRECGQGEWEDDLFVLDRAKFEGFPPDEAFEWAGIDIRKSIYADNSLVELNDIAKLSFVEIADIIEVNL